MEQPSAEKSSFQFNFFLPSRGLDFTKRFMKSSRGVNVDFTARSSTVLASRYIVFMSSQIVL